MSDGADEVLAGQFVCAFCGRETTDDPRYIRIDLSWAHSIATQSLGAHHACLVAALKPGFPLAVEGGVTGQRPAEEQIDWAGLRYAIRAAGEKLDTRLQLSAAELEAAVEDFERLRKFGR